MRCVTGILLTVLLSMAGMESARAATCADDFKTRVAANGECLVIQAYGEPAKKTALVVFIHGDGYRGGPSDYMYPIAQQFAAKGVVAVGLIRPGYYDSNDNSSTGYSYREGDNYQPDVIETVAAAVKVLKNHYKAEYVVLAGHSGGSAISGVIIGKYPGLVNAAVLGACPCNVPDWRFMRRGRNNWAFSLSPHDFIGKIDKKTTVVAVTGSNDDNTTPGLARGYVNDLKENGIDATFIEIPGRGHGGIEQTEAYLYALVKLLVGRSYGMLEASKECPKCGNTPKLPESAIGMDIDAKAQRLIKDWGENAAKVALKKANEMEVSGDSESQAIWLKVRARIEKQQN